MTIHVEYPSRLAVIRDHCLGVGALIIESKGLIKINHEGRAILCAYRRIDAWIVDISGHFVYLPADGDCGQVIGAK